LLDTCLHVCAGVALPAAGESVLLAFGVERLQVHGLPAGPLWCWARLRPGATAESPTFDLELWEEAPRRLVATITGLSLRRGEREALRRGARPNLADWLYEVVWEPRPRANTLQSAEFLAGPESVAHGLVPRAVERLDDVAAACQRALPELEASATEYAVAALSALVAWEPGRRLSVARLANECGVVPRQRRLVGRLLEMLGADGLLRRVGDEWTVVRTLPPLTPDARLAGLMRAYPSAQVEAVVLQRCGAQLAGVLRGRCEALPLLFPTTGELSAELLYRDSPVARAFNILVGEAIAAAAAALPPHRRLRVLEIGAGTGGTTAAALERLSPERTDYVFSDVSAGFLAPARDRLAGYSFVDYRVLDIERDPLAQGFRAHDFDVVVAANVLHATADLRQVLARVRQLLAPSGLLLLLEGTVPQRWVDVTFGLLPGWWKFADAALRPAHPLLSAAVWRRLLTEEGFTEATFLPKDEAVLQALVLARGPAVVAVGGPPLPAGRRLAFADAGDVGAALAARLAATGDGWVRVEVGAGYERLDEGRYQLDPSQPAAFAQLLAEVGVPLREVVYLAGLDAAANGDGLPAAALSGCVGALHLVQALARLGGPALPRLVLVTRGAQVVAAGDGVDSVAQATLWGLARVIAHEHPELRCCRIDLDPAEDSAEAVQRLVAELSASDGEEELAFRAGDRYTARLGRIDPGALALADQPRRWTITERGTPDLLTLQPLVRGRPGSGEIEIQVQAAGLNFLDVMDVLGVLPFARSHLGAECAGRITAVGDGVRDLAVGDEVFALAQGTFATHVTTPAVLAVRRPTHLSAGEAATVPVAFLTAEYALHRLGGLKAGQTVLIHAAAGGVGLAAVQIAQLAGAKVFATASPAKNAYLRGLGVEYVFHSRTTEFTEEILRLTRGRGVDLVLNSLSSGDFIPKSLSVLCREGCFLEMGKRGIWSADQVRALRPDISYRVVALERLGIDEPATIQAMLGDLSAALAVGRLRPLPRTVYPLAEAVAAVRCMQKARHIGKIVLEVPQSLESVVRTEASYLITGGLGGLGLLTAERLVERGARHLVLLGRSVPSEAARAGIAGLQQLGATVVVLQADVSVEAEVAGILDQITRTLPPLRGIVHAAGELDDSVLLNQSEKRFARVLAAKVAGAWYLHRLTQAMPLDFFILYSSAAALLGPAGQGNHAAANAFLDALASYRQARGLPGMSINWGAWSEVGAAARRGVLERAADRGMGVINPESGLVALERILGLGKAQVGVLPADWSRLRRQGAVSPLLSRLVNEGRPGARGRGERERASDWPGRIKAAAPGERLQLLVGYLQGLVGRVLGLGAGQLPEQRTGFFELGMDSLMAVELRNRLQADLGGLTLSATVVFDHPTVEALAKHLATTLGGELVAAPVGNGALDDRTENLDQLDADELLERMDMKATRLLGKAGTS
jgi:NADPH:quinone reductase-like Zn-dependent oxidoreductase/SAM-dependent methyltransferase